jgi:iron complex transport system ATP-binding protein
MTPLAEALGLTIEGRLSPTDLSIEPSGMIAVIGPNGGGKTSLLRAFARTEDSTGAVRIEGIDLDRAAEPKRRKLVAFLPASRDAAWPVSVADTLAFGLEGATTERIGELLDMLELDPLKDRPIDRLSTGERARAMLGRALAGKARLLLLDEPLSNLDPYWVLRTLDLLRAEVAANASSALVSVHDLSLLPRFDRVLLVDQGRIVADDGPEEMIEKLEFGTAFRIAKSGAGWAINPLADPRSSR